ncbi:L domain-like protein [Lindgomyces ingoldianus]|uniref:L domain-like protein n=1 Tax=Lindgomyces ingoldianus TaxID=673940 RepID=A0ACB6Q8S0_9PLEO|nr:L domain-like protein [Lindgomyces ingoldianus]KAF2462576.1 L domain-like protein [Lindgomyces ingoldianus]
MDPPSSLPVRTSGIPRPPSRLPVLRSSASQSQLRPASSAEQLRKKSSFVSLSKPAPAPAALQKKPSSTSLAPAMLQKKPSRASLAHTTTPSTTASNTSLTRASLTSAKRRTTTVPNNIQARTSNNDATVFKKPIGRAPSGQTRVKPAATPSASSVGYQQDELGDLEGFRSASRASSRAGYRDNEPEQAVESDNEPVKPPRKARPSLSDRTIESLSQLPSSPAGKGRRRSSFFSADNSMPPPARPASALGNNRRPMTSDGTPQSRLATPGKAGGLSPRGSMTAPGKRSVSAALLHNLASTPSKTPPIGRPSSHLRKQPLSQMQNVQTTPKPRPLSNSKTMTARTPKARPSLTAAFGKAISPPASVVPLTPSPGRENYVDRSPESSRKVSNSSAALREQIAKAKAARRSGASKQTPEMPGRSSSSSSALREQIAKAKEAARRANASRQFGTSTPPREVPAVTENEYGIEPDPAEISQFDFGLDDPFNQHPKGAKALIRKRIDSARVEGRLNLAAMGLSKIPDDVLDLYKYDPSDDNEIAWGEIVDLTSIIAADNELTVLPEGLFPDIDVETVADDSDVGSQFGGIQTLDLHGNILQHLPVGLRRLSQLSKLNLSRNKLPMEALDIISQITSLRELKLADNAIMGPLPASLRNLNQLEVLELQNNKLTELPSEIRELAHLRSLNVSDNQLRQLPTELFTSVPIIELIASKNVFSGSFFDVDTVPHLQTLQIRNNSISSLCENGTVLLPALKTLDITANRLSALPDISSWTSLTTLLVGENKLTTLPEGFLSLQKLRTADFTANDLIKLDERIAWMDGLENLTVTANPIRDRKFLTMNTEDIKRDLQSRLDPSDIDAPGADTKTAELSKAVGSDSDWTLKPSGTLDLSFKNLTVVDEELMASFAESNDIRQLHLQQNYLVAIPPVLSQINLLTVLDLSKNGITKPLTETLQLPKLRELRLMGNKLRTLNHLMEFLSAPYLQHLDVSNNHISGPLPILREAFPGLLLLMASDNVISEVSAESLDGLKIVNLSNNEISRLEPRIGLLAGTLTGLDVEGNKFRVPSYTILKKGTDAVLKWLRDKIPSPIEEL